MQWLRTVGPFQHGQRPSMALSEPAQRLGDHVGAVGVDVGVRRTAEGLPDPGDIGAAAQYTTMVEIAPAAGVPS